MSVLTPVYNGEPYLAECIDSVRAQRYPAWEHVIVDNASTDSTRAIAAAHARVDSRIRVISNARHVGVTDNHNIAFRSMSPSSRYCKIVSADDSLFPDCLLRLVECAEAHPSAGIVGSYQLREEDGRPSRVVWDGLPHAVTLVSGRDICRWHLLGHPYVFGTPTSVLYRGDLVRDADPFFPGSSPHADTAACYEHLRRSDFAFVHQVLSCERVHTRALSTTLRQRNDYVSANVRQLLDYGPIHLTTSELETRLRAVLDEYYGFLVQSALRLREVEFWDFHRRTLHDLGYPLLGAGFARALARRLLDAMVNPGDTLAKVALRLRSATPRRTGHDDRQVLLTR